ncbi:3-phosphoserine/phosphohydroxythreonine transaminase [Roseateles sp. BYS180W]|uniref:Phosphoserine aminotransferase n=1 Tax=Roseateles rivi TaxID=3299028 RepID=A0ABW7FY23_9BURK
MTQQRPFNFSAGPAALPEAVLQRVAEDMLSWRGCGMGVMEMSHRGKEFKLIADQAQRDLRQLLAVPEHFHILFMQGGALAHNAIVPMNLAQRGGSGKVDVVVSGSWSAKSAAEARKYADVQVVAQGADAQGRYTEIPSPSSWQLRRDTAYVHVCSNETIDGLEMHELPDLAALGCHAPLVVDFSSHVASRRIDWSRIGLAFGGAQKNIGPAGLTLVIVREDLLGHASATCPSALNYEAVAKAESMFNTPPTFGIYVAGLVFEWLLAQQYRGLSGLAAVEQRNIDKAALLYEALDASPLFESRVAVAARSRMNIPFFLKAQRASDALYETFLTGAQERGLLQLKGHKSAGGLRASLYNAMPIEGVQALVRYLKEFELQYG